MTLPPRSSDFGNALVFDCARTAVTLGNIIDQIKRTWTKSSRKFIGDHVFVQIMRRRKREQEVVHADTWYFC